MKAVKDVSDTMRGVEEWDPATRVLGKVVLGLGLAAIVLWLSPYALTDLIMTFGVPLLIIGMLLLAMGLVGAGFLDFVNDKEIGKKVQDYVREHQEQTA